MVVAPRRRKALAVFAALVSLSAFAGTVGLATGSLGLPAELTARLPFGSALFGGIALAVVVGLPTALVAWLAWHADRRTDHASLGAGVLLVGWIVFQLLFLRELSFLHPTYLAVGVLFVWAGRRALPRHSPVGRRR